MNRTRFSRFMYTSMLLLLGASLPLIGQQPGGGSSPSSMQQPAARPNINDPMNTTQNDTPQKMDDKKFLKEAAEGGLAEVELGKLASQKASSPEVKQFAQKMVDDHTKANDQLKQVASAENVSVPNELDSKHQSRLDKLSKLSGDSFDKAYVKDQLKDHETYVRDFNNEAQNGSDPKVKAFASATLPTLQQHLDLVKSLNKTEKEAGKSDNAQ